MVLDFLGVELVLENIVCFKSGVSWLVIQEGLQLV